MVHLNELKKDNASLLCFDFILRSKTKITSVKNVF